MLTPASGTCDPSPDRDAQDPVFIARVLVSGLGIDFSVRENGLDDYRRSYRLVMDTLAFAPLPRMVDDFLDDLLFVTSRQPFRNGDEAREGIKDLLGQFAGQDLRAACLALSQDHPTLNHSVDEGPR